MNAISKYYNSLVLNNLYTQVGKSSLTMKYVGMRYSNRERLPCSLAFGFATTDS